MGASCNGKLRIFFGQKDFEKLRLVKKFVLEHLVEEKADALQSFLNFLALFVQNFVPDVLLGQVRADNCRVTHSE